MAGCMMMALPLLLLFIVCQKKLLGNVSLGGLK
jgi:ABC-type maltose transport system permease subunit